MPAATKHTCTYDVHGSEPVHQKAGTRAQRLSAILIPFPNKTIARIADVGIDAAKSWRSGRRFPQWEYLNRLQASIPSVRSFVAAEFGFQADTQAALISALERAGNDSTPEAAFARSLHRSLTQ